MKKITLLAALVFSIFTAQAQDSGSNSGTGLEIGLKASPALATNRFSAPDDLHFENKNVEFRGSIGLVLDYFFSENYALATGLEYGVKGGHISYHIGSNSPVTDELNIQYIMLPIGLKLYTNEVATDTRIFFQLGTSLNGRVSSKINANGFYRLGGSNEDIKANKLFEADAVLGVGAEWQLGSSTKFFGGLSYHRGLVDIDRFYETGNGLGNKDIAIRNNIFALDLGLKF
jgi:hypothetical protein